MKKIKTNYATKVIDGKFYGKINVENQTPVIFLTEDDIKEGKQGYVLAPYVLVDHTEESSKRYTEFMDEYYKQHERCPICGAEEHLSTLVGYILDFDRKDEYKDMNSCECMGCGDKHSAHDRVPSNGININ